jgi:hypothetical protein
MKNVFKAVILTSVFSMLFCCSSKDVRYYENGSVKEERFSKWNNKSNPYLIKRYNHIGKVNEVLNYDDSGYLKSSVKIESNGDSIIDQFVNNEEKLFRRIYTGKNELIKQHYNQGKMTGVSYYFKNSILLKRMLYEDGIILACDISEEIDKEKIVKVSPEGDINDEHVMPEIYKNYRFATTQYLNLPEEGYSPVGIYFSNDSMSYPDASVSSFVYMNLPDTASCSEEIKGEVFGNFSGKDSVYLKVYLFNIDETPKEGVIYKKISSSRGNLAVDFKFIIDEPGYHFLCGYAYLMRNDSTQIQNYIIYDDVYILKKH